MHTKETTSRTANTANPTTLESVLSLSLLLVLCCGETTAVKHNIHAN